MDDYRVKFQNFAAFMRTIAADPNDPSVAFLQSQMLEQTLVVHVAHAADTHGPAASPALHALLTLVQDDSVPVAALRRFAGDLTDAYATLAGVSTRVAWDRLDRDHLSKLLRYGLYFIQRAGPALATHIPGAPDDGR